MAVAGSLLIEAQRPAHGPDHGIVPVSYTHLDVYKRQSLHYELPVLKTIAYELLLSIPRTAPEHLVAHRLLKVLHYFLPVDGGVMEEIPPLSILREFIGECSFYDMH